MYKFVSALAIAAISLLAVGIVAARPPQLPRPRPQHFQVHGPNHLTHAKAMRLRNGTHRLHQTSHGHQSFVTLKNGKVANMHMITKNGKKVRPLRARRVASLDRHDSDTVPVGLGDGTLGTGGGILITFQIGPLRITFFWPMSMCSPDLINGTDGGDGTDGGIDGGDGTDGTDGGDGINT
jgi:hypothetical protein